MITHQLYGQTVNLSHPLTLSTRSHRHAIHKTAHSPPPPPKKPSTLHNLNLQHCQKHPPLPSPTTTFTRAQQATAGCDERLRQTRCKRRRRRAPAAGAAARPAGVPVPLLERVRRRRLPRARRRRAGRRGRRHRGGRRRGARRQRERCRHRLRQLLLLRIRRHLAAHHGQDHVPVARGVAADLRPPLPQQRAPQRWQLALRQPARLAGCRRRQVFQNSEHTEAAAAGASWRQQDGGAVAQGQEGEAEGGDEGAQRAGARRRVRGGHGRGGRRRGRRHRGVGRQGRPLRAHRHGGGVRGDAGGRAVRRGRRVHGRRARAPRRRRRLRRQRQNPRRHRHHHGRRRHSVASRVDAEGEGAEGGVERRRGDPGGEGLHRDGRPQARRPEAAAAAESQGAGAGQQQQQQLQRRPAGAGPGREQQLPRHLLPGAARPRHRAPQAHPQRIVALEGRVSVHQPDGRGDAEDEEPACCRDHHQEEEERGGGRVQGRGGVAGAAPAGGGRAPALLRPAHGGAPGDRIRVREPEGSRHVDQGRRAPPRHRRWAQALRLTPTLSLPVISDD